MSDTNFEVAVDAGKAVGGSFASVASKLNTIQSELSSITSAVAKSSVSGALYTPGLLHLGIMVRQNSEGVTTLQDSLEKIMAHYRFTELVAAGTVAIMDSSSRGTSSTEGENSFVSWLKNLWNKIFPPHDPTPVATEIDSIVFDGTGSYGGDQGSPQSATGAERAALYDIVRKYYPNFTDSEIAHYLNKLNDEGCGYTAVINTILAAYAGRSAEFEKTFGFPLYASNGDLNFNRLLVDFYSATDNHNRGLFGDTVNPNEDYSATDGLGTSPSMRAYRTQLYLNDKGASVKVSSKKVTPANFNKLSKDGYVVISYQNGTLQNAAGKDVHSISSHAMVVTGVTADGRYIVSSWGEKYYIDPNESGTVPGKETTMRFEYYEYN